MGTKLYYFSATGNTLKIARLLADQLGEATLISIPSAAKKDFDVSAESAGILFPVYAWGLPLLVADFISKITISKDTYLFAVATCGSMTGRALYSLQSLLTEKHAHVSAGFKIKMPGNYIPFYGAPSEERQQKMFAEANERVVHIADSIKQKKVLPLESDMPILNRLMSSVLYRGFCSKVRSADECFHADDTCTSCGACVRVCPVNNITMVNSKPQWLHHCEQCMGCLQWCPVEAIQYKTISQNRKRYHHPDISISDMYV